MDHRGFTFILICLGLLIIPVTPIAGQQVSKAEIENTDFGLKEGKIEIRYDLVKSKKEEIFTVFVLAISETGDTIQARSVTGDVNDNIPGGRGKVILWDYEKDNFYTTGRFSIEVHAISASPEITAKPSGGYPNLGMALLMSTALPGLGSTKLKDGKPHWIKGIAGYGSIALSYVYNKKAADSYDNYLPSMDTDVRKTYYDDAVLQKRLSTVFAASAIAIWALDYVCVIVSHNKLSKTTYNNQSQKVSFGYSYDPVFAQPLLSVRLTF